MLIRGQAKKCLRDMRHGIPPRKRKIEIQRKTLRQSGGEKKEDCPQTLEKKGPDLGSVSFFRTRTMGEVH